MSAQEKPPPCESCDSLCCRYVATQIDTPTCKRDYDNIRWYLKHNDVTVFQDNDGDWFVEFEATCSELGPDGRCLDYENRPDVCRSHGEGEVECEFVSDKLPYRVRFSTAVEYERYLDEKGIDWRWKRERRRGVEGRGAG